MSFKIIFILSVINKWSIHKIDIKSAFIQNNLTEIIYIKQSIEFENLSHSDWNLKLNKALYDLKQSAKIWFEILSNIFKDLNFI